MSNTETERRAALVAAEAAALQLLEMIEAKGLIAPGRTEAEIQDEIGVLAHDHFGVAKHWHKRIVRAGTNTITIAGDNPPVRTLAPDDTVYVDLGPVFETWEADVGRTYALGDDPDKQRLVRDLERTFTTVQAYAHATPGITGADLYAFAQQTAAAAGWDFGGKIAGHIVSEFPHAYIPGDKELNRISPGNPTRLDAPDTLGRERYWILEIHLVDAARTYGGFFERLL